MPEDYGARNCPFWWKWRFDVRFWPKSLSKPSELMSRNDSWKRGHTLKLWWARWTRSLSNLIFLFVSFACHICLIHPTVCLTSPLLFFNVRDLQASQTPFNWLESEKLSVNWTAEWNESDWLDYDLQGLVKFRYAFIAITLSQLLELSDGVDEIGRDPVELFLIFLQLQWWNWSC